MSELMRAKQRLLFRSNSIAQAFDEQSDFKKYARTGNAASIPKLHAKDMNKKQRSISQLEIKDNDFEYQVQIKNASPGFMKTQRLGLFNRNDKSDTQSVQVQHLNLFGRRQSKSRRITQHSKISNNNNNEMHDMSFTQNNPSLYNQSPQKIIKSTVHNDKMNVIITKVPQRRAYSPFKPKQCSFQILQSYLNQKHEQSNLFVDQMFPPRFTIIFNKKYMYLEQGLQLQRITKIYEGNQIRLIKFCQPTLMAMGKFTSPALYSALVILSEDPARVLNILGNQQYNQNGIYYVHVCKDGVWRYVVIDDYLPVKILAKRSLLFLHSFSRNGYYQFWPAVIQKALAKVYGTYQDVFLTSYKGIKDIFRNLTGYPVSQYRINKDFRTFLIIIDSAIKKKQVVVLQQIPEQYQQTAHVKGIQIDISYQIIEVKKTYITIRNLAEKQLVTKLTFQQAMIFTRLLIFRNENNYSYISRTLRHKKSSYSILKVNIKVSTKCYWDIWQNSQIYYKNHIGSSIQYRKSPYRIVIKEQPSYDTPTLNPVQSFMPTKHEQKNDEQNIILTQSGKQITLKPGLYQIFIHLCQLKQQDFTISFYGQQEIQIERVKNMSQWNSEDCQCQ